MTYVHWMSTSLVATKTTNVPNSIICKVHIMLWICSHIVLQEIPLNINYFIMAALKPVQVIIYNHNYILVLTEL